MPVRYNRTWSIWIHSLLLFSALYRNTYTVCFFHRTSPECEKALPTKTKKKQNVRSFYHFISSCVSELEKCILRLQRIFEGPYPPWIQHEQSAARSAVASSAHGTDRRKEDCNEFIWLCRSPTDNGVSMMSDGRKGNIARPALCNNLFLSSYIIFAFMYS